MLEKAEPKGEVNVKERADDVAGGALLNESIAHAEQFIPDVTAPSSHAFTRGTVRVAPRDSASFRVLQGSRESRTRSLRLDPAILLNAEFRGITRNDADASFVSLSA